MDERLQVEDQLEAVMPFALSMIVDSQKRGMALPSESALEHWEQMKKNVEEQHWRLLIHDSVHKVQSNRG